MRPPEVMGLTCQRDVRQPLVPLEASKRRQLRRKLSCAAGCCTRRAVLRRRIEQRSRQQQRRCSSSGGWRPCNCGVAACWVLQRMACTTRQRARPGSNVSGARALATQPRPPVERTPPRECRVARSYPGQVCAAGRAARGAGRGTRLALRMASPLRLGRARRGFRGCRARHIVTRRVAQARNGGRSARKLQARPARPHCALRQRRPTPLVPITATRALRNSVCVHRKRVVLRAAAASQSPAGAEAASMRR